MEFSEIMESRRDYYSQVFILWEILRVLHDKELAFLSAKGFEPKKAFRFFWANSFDSMKSHFNFVQLDKIPLNLYCSVADLKFPLPIFSYHLEKRKEDTNYIEFNKNYKNYVKNYSLFFDFDGKTKTESGYVVDIDKCYKEVARFKIILDEYKVPYYLIPSSFSGFHIIIPSEYMEFDNLDKLLLDLNILVMRVAGDYGFEMLDQTVVDIKRIRKLPFSMSCDGCVILPLSDYDFKNYSPERLTWKFIKSSIMLKNRGLLIRQHGLTELELRENVKRFIFEHIN